MSAVTCECWFLCWFLYRNGQAKEPNWLATKLYVFGSCLSLYVNGAWQVQLAGYLSRQTLTFNRTEPPRRSNTHALAVSWRVPLPSGEATQLAYASTTTPLAPLTLMMGFWSQLTVPFSIMIQVSVTLTSGFLFKVEHLVNTSASPSLNLRSRNCFLFERKV